MAKTEGKFIYRIVAQKKGITIAAETSREMTQEEARKTGASLMLDDVNKTIDFEPFVLLPIATQERWDDQCINFCPRCGANLQDHELEQSDVFDCDKCETRVEVHIYAYAD